MITHTAFTCVVHLCNQHLQTHKHINNTTPWYVSQCGWFTPTASLMILLVLAGRGRQGQIRMRIRIWIRGVCKNSRGRGWEEGFQKVVRAVWALRLYSVAGDKDIVE